MFYFNMFFIYSFLGFLFENVLALVTGSQFNSGVLYGPWTFIYGFAIFILMGYDKWIKKYKFNKWLEVFLFFLGASFLMSGLEFLGGVLIENIFHVVYWDYTNMKFNMGNYVCLEASIFWGLFATIVNYFITPLTLKLEKKIPKYITIIFIILFLIDVVATIVN